MEYCVFLKKVWSPLVSLCPNARHHLRPRRPPLTITQDTIEPTDGGITITRGFANNDDDLGGAEYDLSYGYDLGGNRLTKTDSLTAPATTYHYDITDFDDGG